MGPREGPRHSPPCPLPCGVRDKAEGSGAGGGQLHCVFTVFTGSGDARARAFDAQSGALRRVFRGHAFIINCIQVGAPALPWAAGPVG